VKNPLNVRRENHGCGPTGPRKLHYEQSWYIVSLKLLEITTDFSLLSTGNNNNKPQEVRYNKYKDITTSALFSNQQTALKPQIQIARNLIDKYTQHTDQKSSQSDTVCLPKLFVSQNCSVLKLQQSKLTKLLLSLNLLSPKS
jgi:hypothetical protein